MPKSAITAGFAVLSLFLLPVPLSAQSQMAQTAPPDGPVRLDAVAGIANYVDATRPVDIAVSVSSDVLFAGDLEILQASSLIVIPVEVPAGGSKTYQATVPPPIGATQTRLRLLAEGSDQPAATWTMQMKSPGEETLVAVVGDAELAATIDEAAVDVTDGEILTALIGVDTLERGVSPVTYLVLDPATELPEATIDWLRNGGRLVVDEQDVALLGIDLVAVSTDSFTTLYRWGTGRVIAVEDLAGLDVAAWSEVIQPSPIEFAPRDAWSSPDAQMMGAATNAGDQRVPRLPWLLMAVIGYALLIGPVNFFILGKLGRRELAWVTLPLLSVLAVAGFWIAGRSQLETTLVNHATVVVGGESPYARSAVALAVGSGGSRSVGVPEDWDVYPSSVTSNIGELPPPSVAGRLKDDGEFQFDLAQLGAVGLQGVWPATTTAIPEVTASNDGPRLQIDVVNDTDLEFWAWGVVASGRIKVAPDGLAPGAQGVESVVAGNPGFNEGSVGDAVIQARQLWDDPTAWARLSPLGMTAYFDLAQTDATYFFGFTEQLTVPVTVDGSVYRAAGTSLVVVPIDPTQASNTLIASLVDPGDASFIESGPGYLSVATNEMVVGWSVPLDRSTNPVLEVTNIFGEMPRGFDAYDWSAGRFVSINPGQELRLDRFRSPAGDVLVKALAHDENDPQMFESNMSPYGFALVWSS